LSGFWIRRAKEEEEEEEEAQGLLAQKMGPEESPGVVPSARSGSVLSSKRPGASGQERKKKLKWLLLHLLGLEQEKVLQSFQPLVPGFLGHFLFLSLLNSILL
jgi:hypothetical protein